MKNRDIAKALRSNGCTEKPRRGGGSHVNWHCPCGKHIATVPVHRDVSAGVVGDTIKKLECLPEGWLQ